MYCPLVDVQHKSEEAKPANTAAFLLLPPARGARAGAMTDGSVMPAFASCRGRVHLKTNLTISIITM